MYCSVARRFLARIYMHIALPFGKCVLHWRALVHTVPLETNQRDFVSLTDRAKLIGEKESLVLIKFRTCFTNAHKQLHELNFVPAFSVF